MNLGGNLNHLSDDVLLRRTEELVRSEREVLIEVLHHLREIDRRKLFSDLKCTSLFDYAVKKLHYSEDQACRRIAAMRLMKEIPEVTEKISSGSLTLSNIGRAQALFKNEMKIGIKPLDRERKIEILNGLENQTRRAAEKLILKYSSSPTVLIRDQIKAVSSSDVEIKFVAPEELQFKIEKLKGLLAHKFPELTLAELFDTLCEVGLRKFDPCRQAPRAARVKLHRTQITH